MNYELAKKLKTAGFQHTWCDESDCSCLTNGDSNNGTICFPTLSELIEAVGDRFSSLERDEEINLETQEITVIWWAVSDKLVHDVLPGGISRFRGETPEEAIANLWLKLNEPKK